MESEMDHNFDEFFERQADWSRVTFGPDNIRGPIGPLKHLEKESREAQESSGDIEEYADCLFLICDAARRAGFTKEQLIGAAFAKLAKNKARTWPDWKTAPPDTPIEHVRQ
jgi:hypothetical protein